MVGAYGQFQVKSGPSLKLWMRFKEFLNFAQGKGPRGMQNFYEWFLQKNMLLIVIGLFWARKILPSQNCESALKDPFIILLNERDEEAHEILDNCFSENL